MHCEHRYYLCQIHAFSNKTMVFEGASCNDYSKECITLFDWRKYGWLRRTAFAHEGESVNSHCFKNELKK